MNHSGMKKHILGLLDKDVRLDGRKPLDFRKPIDIKVNPSENAEGSCEVRIGGTVVMAGVKLAVEKPYPDSPDAGCLMVNVELLPMSNPEFESGPPGIDAIELSRLVDRAVRESKLIDMKKLAIIEGEKVWSVMIDICPINDEGNLFDAAALSALVALKNAVFPKLEEGEVVNYKEKTAKKLPLDVKKDPVSVTIWKIGKHFIVDPLIDEQKVAEARLTVATLADGNLCAMQKGGDEPLTAEEVMKMIDIASDKSKELRKLIR
ncbi:exosome complex protein Rrp42 [Candidatus Woesearchaeota archaeon]|nr:exosome complex protein Rrp42 [Candidatus Woesearchaeota archaeon]